MAIAYDNSSYSQASGEATTFSLNHTASGSNLIAFVGVNSNDATITGVTYGGVAMTLVNSVSSLNSSLKLYCLHGVTAGSSSVVVSSSVSTYMRLTVVTYSGAKQSSTVDNSGTQSSTGGGSEFSQSLTTVADNCYVGLFCFLDGPRYIVAGSGTTVRTTNNFGNFADSNSQITPAGSKTLNIIANGGNYWGYGSIIFSFSEYTAPAGSSKFFQLF